MSQIVSPPKRGNGAGPAPGAGAKNTRTEAALRAFHEESALGKAYDSRLLKRLWPFVKPLGSSPNSWPPPRTCRRGTMPRAATSYRM